MTNYLTTLRTCANPTRDVCVVRGREAKRLRKDLPNNRGATLEAFLAWAGEGQKHVPSLRAIRELEREEQHRLRVETLLGWLEAMDRGYGGGQAEMILEEVFVSGPHHPFHTPKAVIAEADGSRWEPEASAGQTQAGTSATTGKQIADLVVFPTEDRLISKLSGYSVPAYGAVRLGAAGQDSITYFTLPSEDGDGSVHKFAPVKMYPSGPRLRLIFKHEPSRKPNTNYWYAVIALNAQWKSFDLTPYACVSITARAADDVRSIGKAVRRPHIMVFHLVSRDYRSKNRSGCQHTNWERCEVRHWPYTYRVPLDKLLWNESARAGNTAPVDRRAVVQITFGHEGDESARASGCIEISDIRFTT